MARTTTTAVQTLLGRNYDTRNLPSLDPYVEMATAFVDRVVICAAAKGIAITDAELELIERNMAAHYYTRTDPLYASKSTLSASGSYARGKEVEVYKANAIELDPSGCVNALLGRKKASMSWLGKPKSEQMDWEEWN
jgi:hypothetical protein